MDRRKFNSMVASLAVAGSCPLRAQERYPSRPVRIIVPFAPGGIGDQVARSVGTPLGELLGQSVIVENRPGGDSVTGTVYSAKSQADGYTIMQVSTPQSINMVLREKPGFDLLKDFQPIARVVQGNLVLVVPVSSPARNVAELVNMGKNKSGGLSFGSGGVGSVGHLSGELLKRFANITAMHIPYKGNAAVLPDLIGGRLDFFFASQPEAVHGVSAGQLRALVVTATRRVPTFPAIPTMDEAGYPGFEAMSNYGYMVPANTPATIVRQLQEALGKVVAMPSIQERFQAMGVNVAFGGPDELASTLKGEITRWGQVVKSANIKAE